MKNILVFDKFLGYNVGGAQKSLHALLENVFEDIFYLGCNVKKAFLAEKYKVDKIKVERFNIKEIPKLPYFEYFLNRNVVKKNIKNSKRKILITQGLYGAVAVNNFKGDSIYFIRDEYSLNRIPVHQKGFTKILKYIYLLIQFPFLLIMFRDNKKAVKKAKVVIANSKYIKDELFKKFGIDAEVVYPIINIKELKSQEIPKIENRKYVTSIGSEVIKGSKIVENIAKIMPDYNFMIVGRSFKNPIVKDNVLYQPWSQDIMDIYKKTRILLIPSVCNEAFGRTAVEALSLGIPVLGTNRGGIKEVLPPDNMLEDIENISLWKNKILNIKVGKGVDVSRFILKKQVDRFNEVLNKI